MFLLLSVSSNYHKSEHKKPQLVILLLVLWALAAEGREGEHASSSSMIWKKRLSAGGGDLPMVSFEHIA